MTEDEATTKVCCGPPHVAWATMLLVPGARPNDLPTFDHCIGSACMAWRTVQRNVHPKPVDDAHTVAIGFCGLAGAPQ